MMLFNMHLMSSEVAQGKEPGAPGGSGFDPWVTKILG